MKGERTKGLTRDVKVGHGQVEDVDLLVVQALARVGQLGLLAGKALRVEALDEKALLLRTGSDCLL